MRKGMIVVVASLVLWFLFYGMKSVEGIESKAGSRMTAIEKAVGGQ